MIGGTLWALHNTKVQTYITQRLATHLSEKINARISIGKVKIAFFNKIELQNVLLEDQNADTLVFVENVQAHIDTLKIRQKRVALGRLALNGTQINAKRDSVNRFNFSFIIDSLKTGEPTPNEWQYSCRDFSFSDAAVTYRDFNQQEEQQLNLEDFNINISDFALIEDSLFFNIRQLALNDGKEFSINNFSSTFSFSGNEINFAGVNLETRNSEISDSRFRVVLPDSADHFLEEVLFDFSFSHSQISFYDVAQLAPALRGMDQVVDCSGQITGNLANLRGREIELSTGNHTYALLDFYANDLTSTETMYLFVDLKQSRTNFRELSRIKLPGNGKPRFLDFPEQLYEAGQITYRGNFTGFLTDFVAYGTLNSRMGRITTDLAVVPDERKNIAYRGKVETEDFRLGELIKNQYIGDITFSGQVDGSYDLNKQMLAGDFSGDILSVDINQYQYENIRLDGILDNRMFDGLVMMNDSNLQFDFLGKINFNPEVPVFDFRLDLRKANPGNLNLLDRYPEAEVAFLMNANFSGNQIDNLTGAIKVESGYFMNRNGDLNLGGIELQSIASGLNNYLSFTSAYFDIDINGIYHFQNIADAFEKSMYRYMPAVGQNDAVVDRENKFGYQIDVKNLDDLTAVFTPGINIETPFLLYGQMDSEQSVFELKGSIPMFRTNDVMLRNIFIGNNPRDSIYVSRFRFGEVLLKNGMGLKNFTIESEIADNTIFNQITWGEEEGERPANQKKYSGSLTSKAVFQERKNSPFPIITIEGFPSEVFVADSLWQMSAFTGSVDSSAFRINDFLASSGSQSIGIGGKIAADESAILSLFLNNINLSYLGVYMDRDLPLEGNLSGLVELQDFYGERLVYSDLGIERFGFRDQEIGNVSLYNKWDNERMVLASELEIRTKERQNLFASGSYNPQTRELLYHADFDHLSLVILETVIRNNFSNFHGDGTGKLKIHGTPDKILLTGAIEGSNAGLTIDYTQVSYHFTDSVFFKGDTIHFDRITLRDMSGNRGFFNGTLVHRNFQDMQYNLSFSSSRIMAINTTARDNPQFFGQVLANGRLNITGQGKRVNLTGSGTTLLGTSVNISLEDESVLERYDFIQFVSTEDTRRQEFLFPQTDSDFSLDLTITATPEARAQLIYNSQIGDVIRAQGEGVLRFGMNNEGAITLSGAYTVERGDYLFTLQNVINKRFTIEQGGTIEWSGDPYNALINISAVYKLKASLYDLLVNTYDNIYQSQRIPVECKILLTEELSNPTIDFAIDFPTVEDRLVEELRQFFNTTEEMNKQILSLVVLGKFYTPEYLRGTYEAQNPNLIGTTASELFSNQLSNWLSQISSNVDIGLNYRPGNQITNDEIELALSTQMFNDRVTINGNIGNNTNPLSSNNSQLVGDFDVNVKLIPSGKLRFKAYNRSNNNLIYETAPYTQGVGFTFTEDFNDFGELLGKMRAIFTRKDEE
jgi:hypothetical protein